MKYSVKLYGHLSDDKDRFSHELADVLKTDVDRATALIREVPVVIRAGVSKTEAERMAGDLAGIRALYLIEPEGPEPESEQPRKPLLEIPVERSPGEEETKTLRRGYMGLAVLVGGLAIFLIVGSISFFSLFQRIRTENQGPVNGPNREKPQSEAGTDSRSNEPSPAAMQNRIEGLESRNEQLRSLLKLKQGEVAKGTSSFQMDFDGLRRSRQELRELQEEISSNLVEISRLQNALNRTTPQGPSRFR
jgi:hypothetical protein